MKLFVSTPSVTLNGVYSHRVLTADLRFQTVSWHSDVDTSTLLCTDFSPDKVSLWKMQFVFIETLQAFVIVTCCTWKLLGRGSSLWLHHYKAALCICLYLYSNLARRLSETISTALNYSINKAKRHFWEQKCETNISGSALVFVTCTVGVLKAGWVFLLWNTHWVMSGRLLCRLLIGCLTVT